MLAMSLQWLCTFFKFSPRLLYTLLSTTKTSSTNEECLFALYGPRMTGSADRLY